MTSLEYSPEEVQQWLDLYNDGLTFSEIADKFDVSTSQVAERVHEREQGSIYQSREEELRELMQNIRGGGLFITGETGSRDERKKVILRIARALERRDAAPMETKHAKKLAHDGSLGVSPSAVDNLLGELVEEDRLERVEQGKYMLSHSEKDRKPIQALSAYLNGTDNEAQALGGIDIWKKQFLDPEYPSIDGQVSRELDIYKDVIDIISSLSKLEKKHERGRNLVSNENWSGFALRELAKFGLVDKREGGFSLNAEGTKMLKSFRDSVQ
jgi:Mn-dependent DtxR family transcriptional regulator